MKSKASNFVFILAATRSRNEVAFALLSKDLVFRRHAAQAHTHAVHLASSVQYERCSLRCRSFHRKGYQHYTDGRTLARSLCSNQSRP
jgi:hypothetical protein